jgi:hypothetical protein
VLEKLSQKITQISRGWLALTSLAVMIGFMVFVLPQQATRSQQEIGSSRSPDTSLIRSPGELYQIAEEFGPEGRQSYLKFRWTFDLVYPLIYTSFLTLGIGWFSRHLSGWSERWKIASIVPLLGGLFDYLENISITILMLLLPIQVPILAGLCFIFIWLKWIMIGLAFIIYFIFALGALYGWLTNQFKTR